MWQVIHLCFFFVIADKLLYLLIDRLRHPFTSLDKGFRDVVRFLVDYRSSRASHPIDGRYDYSYALQYFRNCSFWLLVTLREFQNAAA